MANGYIRISQNDIIFDNDNNVVYWKNGGRILGEVVSCIDSNDDVHYYLKTTNIKKAILIDAFVPVGVQDYNLFSDSANFINIQINEEDFSGDGGGNGISITFLLPEGKYYTCKYVEANGDIKIYDAAGDGGQIGGGGSGLPDTDTASVGDVLTLDSDKMPVWAAGGGGGNTLYIHTIEVFRNATDRFRFVFNLINSNPTPYTKDTLYDALPDNKDLMCSGGGFKDSKIYFVYRIKKGVTANSLSITLYNTYDPATDTYVFDSTSVSQFFNGGTDKVNDSVLPI